MTPEQIARQEDRELSEWLNDWRWSHVCDGICAARGCTHANVPPEPHDFRTDEIANAKLLEKLPEFFYLAFEDRQWSVVVGGVTAASDPDRKTAIVQAALQIVRKERK